MVRAIDFHRAGRLEEARDEYRLAIRDESGGVGAELQLLDVLVGLKAHEEVLALAAQLEERGIRSAAIQLAKAAIFRSQGLWPAAQEAARQATAADPDSWEAWWELSAACHGGNDHLDEGLRAAEEAFSLAPGVASCAEQLSLCQAALARYHDAAATTARWVRLSPADPVAWYNLACYWARAGEAEPALDALEEAVRLAPDFARDARQDEDLASLRNDPRLIAITKA